MTYKPLRPRRRGFFYEVLLLAIALAVSLMMFGRGKKNLLQGAVHLLVFVVWCALILEG